MRFSWLYTAGLGLALLAVLAGFWKVLSTPRGMVSLPVYGEIEPFELVDQDGKRFTRDRLKGRVTVINFIFTNCSTACPLLTRQMARLQEKTRALGPGVKLISISVNPADTPDSLKTYGLRFGADFGRWSFLSGSIGVLRKVVVAGFHTAMVLPSKTERQPEFLDIVHGENFVIVDPQARLRAFRQVRTEGDVTEVIKGVKQLLPGNG